MKIELIYKEINLYQGVYPKGLKGECVPLEKRIKKKATIFFVAWFIPIDVHSNIFYNLIDQKKLKEGTL